MSLRRSLRSFAPLAVTLALALGGCASAGAMSDPDEDVAAASEAASEAKPGPKGHEGKFGHGRGHELFLAALHNLDLSAEQRKTIEGAVEKLGRGDHEGMKALGKTLADGVRAGKIDEAAVKAKAAELEKHAAERHAALTAALETLHETLTPKQREALVAHIEERMQKHAGAGNHDKHENHAKHGRGKHGPMAFLLHGLDLRDDQRAKIDAALDAARPEKPADDMKARHEEMRARRKAALEAFRSEKFDPAALLPEKNTTQPFGHMPGALGAIVPILDAEQREALADKLEKGPAMKHFGGHRHGKHGKHGETPEAESR
jgi:Spy/CpxP family protein refolding chaperone